MEDIDVAMKKEVPAWQDKVGNHSQIGGIETSVLDNGLGKGTRIAWINTGSGLRYKVVIDRGLDIVEPRVPMPTRVSNGSGPSRADS